MENEAKVRDQILASATQDFANTIWTLFSRCLLIKSEARFALIKCNLFCTVKFDEAIYALDILTILKETASRTWLRRLYWICSPNPARSYDWRLYNDILTLHKDRLLVDVMLCRSKAIRLQLVGGAWCTSISQFLVTVHSIICSIDCPDKSAAQLYCDSGPVWGSFVRGCCAGFYICF